MTLVALQPAGNGGARDHYADTVERPVPIERMAPYLNSDDLNELRTLYGSRDVPTWGVTPAVDGSNVKRWERLAPGDLVLLVKDGVAFKSGRISFTTQNRALAEHLWGTNENGQTWEYMYFLDDLTDEALTRFELSTLIGDKPGAPVRRFRVLTEEQSRSLLDHLVGRATPSRMSGWAQDIDRDAILASIEEHKSLGREKFLTKYKASPSQRYILVYGGAEFDAKAILHGAQALRGRDVVPSDFRGSKREVADPLKRLGFWVEDLEDVDEPPLSGGPGDYARRAKEILGGTDRTSRTVTRRERDLVRGALGFVKGKVVLMTCDLCGRTLTSDLLVAAHIKKRVDCTDDERLDVANVAMVACTLGCDALFERGYMGVDSGGRLVGSPQLSPTSDVSALVSGLVGRKCDAWRSESASYFAWHIENTFRS